MYLHYLCCLFWAVRVVLAEHETPATGTPITPTGKPVEEVKKKHSLRSTEFITLGAGEGSEKSELQRTLENLYLWQRMRSKATENEVYPPRTREKRSMLAMDKPPTSNIYHLAHAQQSEDKDAQTENLAAGWNLSDFKEIEKMLDDISNWEPTVQVPLAPAPESIEGYEVQEFSEADLKDTTEKAEDDHAKQNEQSADQTSTLSSPAPEPLDHLPSTLEELSVEPNINPEDIFGGEKQPLSVGSIQGIPGLHFPDYEDIPVSPFECADKEYFPGFYADMDTGCQVFHVCYHQRRESFLCPVGTIFNQAILTCDHWYSSNCSWTPLYYSSNAGIGNPTEEVENPFESVEGQKEETKPLTVTEDASSESKVSNTDDNHPNQPETPQSTTESPVSGEDRLTFGGLHLHSKKISPEEYLDLFTKFFPVKVKVTVYPVSRKTKVVAVASIGDIKRVNFPDKRPHTTTTKRPRPSTTKRWYSTTTKRPRPSTTKRWYSTTTKRPRPSTTKRWYSTTTKRWHPTTTKRWHPTSTKRPYHTTTKPHPHTTKKPYTHTTWKPYSHRRSIDPSVNENIHDAFEIVRRILEHVGQLLPSQEGSYPGGSLTYPRSCPCLDRYGNPAWCPCGNRNVYPRWCRCLDENRRPSRCPCRNENWYPRWENPTFREIDALLKAKDKANKEKSSAGEQEEHVKEIKKPCNPINKQVDESKTTDEERANPCDESISNTDEIGTGSETFRDLPQHAVPPRSNYRPLTRLKPRFIVKPVNG